jgi:hypothetical protein
MKPAAITMQPDSNNAAGSDGSADGAMPFETFVADDLPLPAMRPVLVGVARIAIAGSCRHDSTRAANSIIFFPAGRVWIVAASIDRLRCQFDPEAVKFDPP